MPEILISLRSFGSWQGERLIRLIENDDATFYLSCWQTLRREEAPTGESSQPPEDYQQRNWRCEVPPSTVQSWLELLSYQTVVIAPSAPDLAEGRTTGGRLHEFNFARYGSRLQLGWSDPMPPQWEGIAEIVKELWTRAQERAPTELKS